MSADIHLSVFLKEPQGTKKVDTYRHKNVQETVNSRTFQIVGLKKGVRRLNGLGF